MSQWYPRTPAEWDRGRVKSIARRVTDGAHISPDTEGGVYDFVSTRDVKGGQIDFTGSLKTSPETYEYMVKTGCRPVPGDVLFSKDGTVGETAIVREDREFAVASSLVIVSPRSDVMDSSFLAYVFASKASKDQAASMMRGAGLPRLSVGNLARIEVPIPPLLEQRAIADHLDRNTAQIDTLIAKQEQLIATLRERRQVLVERSVARGVACAGKKPSTLSWTPEVPEHWEVANIRRFAQMKTGHTPSRSRPEYWDNATIPWFTLADVWQLRDGRRMYLGETANKISELGLANSAAELLPERTVVLSRTASVGFAGVMPVAMATSQDFWNWVCGPQLHPEYLVYVFRAMHNEFGSMMIGSTHKTIYQPVAASIRIPVPPMDEQHRIVAYLDEQTTKIDTLITKTERFIELAKERRAALITAAVAGQIDVRTSA